MHRPGDDDPHRRRRRPRRPRLDDRPADDPVEPDAFTGPPGTVIGSPGGDSIAIYEPDPSAERSDRGLQRALYDTESGMLPLFAGVRDERPSGEATRGSGPSDLPDDLDSTVDGAALDIDHLLDLEDL